MKLGVDVQRKGCPWWGVHRGSHPSSSGPATPADKDAEIARLRAQVAELQQEKLVLRKAAAYFANEMDR
ncbi:hypothetical protein [Paractinoplanes globisporus]|uniref:hypothetical protein n=1 Tax=Paractinoplanes globisporus TaxID=113565 RepID=UPI0003A14C12|nr:hypothetical protein [Actinoplanes globisporus]